MILYDLTMWLNIGQNGVNKNIVNSDYKLKFNFAQIIGKETCYWWLLNIKWNLASGGWSVIFALRMILAVVLCFVLTEVSSTVVDRKKTIQ